MNILQVISRLDSGDRADDAIASTRFLTLNGHKIIVASPKSGRVKEIDEVGARHYAVSLRPNIFLLPFSIHKLKRVLIKENVQLAHARDGLSAFVSFFALRQAARVFSGEDLKRRPLVTTVYDCVNKGIFEKALFWAKRVIFFTEEEKGYYIKEGLIAPDKAHVLPPFIDAKKEAPKEKTPFRSGRFTVATAVPFSLEKKAQTFLKAILFLSKSINDIKVIAADSAPSGKSDSADSFRVLVKRHSLNNFIDILPDSKDISLLSGCDMFVQIAHPCDINLAARRILRFQASGVPVVATGADWIKSYADDNKTALVCQNDTPEELASKINALYKDAKLRQEIIGRAKDFASREFDIKTVMEKNLSIYEEAKDAFSILIIKIGALGDAILVTPSVRALRKKFPKAKIKILVGREFKDVFANSPHIDELILCDFKKEEGIKGILKMARTLRAHDFDIVVDFQNSLKSHLLGFLSCAPKRFGYDNGKFSFLLNNRIKDTLPPIDPVEHQSKVLALLGLYDIDKKLELWPSKEDEEWAHNFLASHWVKGDTKRIALNIDSSPKWVTKLWPVEYYAEVSARLARDFGIRVVLIGRERENERVKEFLKAVKCRPIVALGRTNIPRLAALVKRCDLLLSSDSAPVHVAASVGTPFLAFFGPTDPKRHLPQVEKYAVLKKDLKCSPCYRSLCDKGYECMYSIKPDEAYRAILELLNMKN